MDILTGFIPAKSRTHRKRKGVTPIAPVALTLVGATFDQTIPAVLLAFDRAIDITGIVTETIHLNDDLITGNLYQGAPLGASQEGPNLVQVNLTSIGSAEGGQVRLTVDAGNGIVAADDAATYSGVTNLLLPFPAPHIATVIHHGDEETILVTLSYPFVSVELPGIEVSQNGVEWLVPESKTILGNRFVQFTFAQDVTGMHQWRVSDPAWWAFADGRNLGTPLSGSF